MSPDVRAPIYFFMKEVDSGNLLLGLTGPGERFRVTWMGVRLHLQIRPVTVKGMIRISREIAHLGEIDESNTVFTTQMIHAGGLYYICRAIAIATGTRFVSLIARAMMGLELRHIQTLWSIVIKQSDPSSFFFIMVSAKGMNKLKTNQPEQQEVQTLSSEG